ncbi:hypothetical protein TeGR_g5946 [Tetraparma gracilis]|uniref:Ankyrin repeat protein n=1 Tax=Tetraparma gracilis TaxID=2962635 RepID=A0ABQ6MD57_9STRA|nr:hypothetical protein TeGR_g5946 [Tetraparma gracilis]
MPKRKAPPSSGPTVAQTNVIRHLFSNSKLEVQTLAGRSSRKTFTKRFDNSILEEWATGLRAVQQDNHGASFDLTCSAEPLALYGTVDKEVTNDPACVSRAAELLAGGSDCNEECELHPKFGTTPLMEAAFHGHSEILTMFIEHNAHLNTSSGIGWTALHYASQANKPDCVALLIAAGARVDMKNAKGKTAQMRAIEQGKQDIVDVFAMMQDEKKRE